MFQSLPARFSAIIAVTTLALGGASAQTFDDALREAVRNNPQLESQRQEQALARERISEARSQRLPDVTLSGEIGYQSVDTTRPFAIGVGDQPVGSAQLEAVVPVYTGGQITAGIRQAKAGKSASDAQYQAAYQNLTLQVLTTYLDVITARESVVIRENSVDLLREQARAASDRFDAGVVTRTDVALSDARLEGGRAALAGAEASLESTEALFEFLVGAKPTELIRPIVEPVLPDQFDDALQIALLENPQIEALEYAERAASEEVKRVEGGLKPSLSIVGNASVQETFTDNFRDTSVSALARARPGSPRGFHQ